MAQCVALSASRPVLAQYRTASRQPRQPAAAARVPRQPRIAARQRLSSVVAAAAPSAPPALVDIEQAARDWDEADKEAEVASAAFDEVAGKPKIVCFRTKRILDLTIKEPVGPDGQPIWAIENYMANSNNFVRARRAMRFPSCAARAQRSPVEVNDAGLKVLCPPVPGRD